MIWTEAIIYENWIIDANQAKIHFLQRVFVFPNQISILTLRKLDDYFLRPLLFNQWQSSIFEGSIATSNLSKNLMVVFSRSSLLTLSGTPVISKHSRLEYWLFPQHCLSNATKRLCSLLFTFFETDNSHSIFWNRCEVRLVICWYWIKCYQILLDIPKPMRSLHVLLVFLKQPQRVTYLLAKQV